VCFYQNVTNWVCVSRGVYSSVPFDFFPTPYLSAFWFFPHLFFWSATNLDKHDGQYHFRLKKLLTFPYLLFNFFSFAENFINLTQFSIIFDHFCTTFLPIFLHKFPLFSSPFPLFFFPFPLQNFPPLIFFPRLKFLWLFPPPHWGGGNRTLYIPVC